MRTTSSRAPRPTRWLCTGRSSSSWWGFGASPAVVVYSLLFLNNLQAGLTHYGTTTAPVIFIEGYVSFRDWWRVGFYASVLNLVIWLAVGVAWWKVLGLW